MKVDAAWRGEPAPPLAFARVAASPFVFEANLRASLTLGAALHRRLSGADPEAALPDVSASAAPLLNRYLAEVGIAERYASPAPTPALAATAPGEWRINDRLHHRHFGAGVVRRIREGGILDIDFDGTLRSIRVGVVALERA